MKAVEFIKKYELSPALAAGFLDHLRRDPEEDVKDDILKSAYKEFSGIDPDENKGLNQAKISSEEKSDSKIKNRDSISKTQTTK
ncbi:hypothetical protein JWG44_03755 [Leptospira sp. 201903071]|uniref:hypothetical protein n=1 Tax=Leptospira ainazelensis TaxID=2810034 RepID=UPI001962B006|nr:hypothetical protein [Leptospira ainazelensis]MBM9499360.1 hypothetical protein [Leptospira ainazelensis]